MENKLIKISPGHYKYRGYDIRRSEYYPPDKCTWWEAVNEETGCGDYHARTLKQIIKDIDEYE